MKDQHLEVDDFVFDCCKKDFYEACYAIMLIQLMGNLYGEKQMLEQDVVSTIHL